MSLVNGFFMGLEAGGTTIFVMRLTAANGEGWDHFDENVAKLVAQTWRLMASQARAPQESRLPT